MFLHLFHKLPLLPRPGLLKCITATNTGILHKTELKHYWNIASECKNYLALTYASAIAQAGTLL